MKSPTIEEILNKAVMLNRQGKTKEAKEQFAGAVIGFTIGGLLSYPISFAQYFILLIVLSWIFGHYDVFYKLFLVIIFIDFIYMSIKLYKRNFLLSYKAYEQMQIDSLAKKIIENAVEKTIEQMKKEGKL